MRVTRYEIQVQKRKALRAAPGPLVTPTSAEPVGLSPPLRVVLAIELLLRRPATALFIAFTPPAHAVLVDRLYVRTFDAVSVGMAHATRGEVISIELQQWEVSIEVSNRLTWQ